MPCCSTVSSTRGLSILVPTARLPSRTIVVETRVSPWKMVHSTPMVSLMRSTNRVSEERSTPAVTDPTTWPSSLTGCPARIENLTTVPSSTPEEACPASAFFTFAWPSTLSPTLSEWPRPTTLPSLSAIVSTFTKPPFTNSRAAFWMWAVSPRLTASATSGRAANWAAPSRQRSW